MNTYTLYKGIKIRNTHTSFERNYTYQYNDNCRVTECTT